jgi:hypothetical protein
VRIVKESTVLTEVRFKALRALCGGLLTLGEAPGRAADTGGLRLTVGNTEPFLQDEQRSCGSKEEREAFPSTEGKNPWTTEAL